MSKRFLVSTQQFVIVVFGVDDAKWGEAVHAAVELHDGAVISADNVITFVKQHLDLVKAPKMVHIADNLPRSAVGKILRCAAKDLFGQRWRVAGSYINPV